MSRSNRRTGAAPRRLWELDLFRGFAILNMALFHFLFDLKYFGIHPSVERVRSWPEFFWSNYSTGISAAFLSLVGIAATVRASQLGSANLKTFLSPAKRVLTGALIVTAISFIFNPELPIFFGILHCIGLSLLLLPLYLKLGRWNLLLGSLMLPIGHWMNNQPVHFKTLVWFGLKPTPMPMGDYYPLLPWSGLILIGIGFSFLFELSKKENLLPQNWKHSSLARSLSFLGRHSLLIYLIHQPIILVLTSLVGLTRFPH